MYQLPSTNVPEYSLRREVSKRYREAVNPSLAYPLFSAWDRARSFPKAREGAKLNGLRFEKKVLEALDASFENFLPSLPLQYWTPEDGKSFCIPDGVLVFPREVVCVEVKLQHVVEAWFQLTKLYFPVLEKAFRRPVRGLEIVKHLNPDVRFPVPVEVYPSVESFLKVDSTIGVCLWRP